MQRDGATREEGKVYTQAERETQGDDFIGVSLSAAPNRGSLNDAAMTDYSLFLSLSLDRSRVLPRYTAWKKRRFPSASREIERPAATALLHPPCATGASRKRMNHDMARSCPGRIISYREIQNRPRDRCVTSRRLLPVCVFSSSRDYNAFRKLISKMFTGRF